METLQDVIKILEKLGVEPAKIKISKQVFNELKERAKNLAFKQLLDKK